MGNSQCSQYFKILGNFFSCILFVTQVYNYLYSVASIKTCVHQVFRWKLNFIQFLHNTFFGTIGTFCSI